MQTGSLYTGMAGLQAINARMQAAASNLANIQTPGYAAVQAMAEAASLPGAKYAPSAPTRWSLTPKPDTQPGPLNQTGDPLNVGAWRAMPGWRCRPAGKALTRDGRLQITSAGILTDSAGNPVLNTTGQPISVPSLTKLEIGTRRHDVRRAAAASRAGRRRSMARSIWWRRRRAR